MTKDICLKVLNDDGKLETLNYHGEVVTTGWYITHQSLEAQKQHKSIRRRRRTNTMMMGPPTHTNLGEIIIRALKSLQHMLSLQPILHLIDKVCNVVYKPDVMIMMMQLWIDSQID